MKHAIAFPLLLAAACLLLSCSGAKEATVKSYTVLEPVTEADKSITKNGVTVDIQSINPSNVGGYPELAATYSVYSKSFLESQPSLVTATERNVLGGFSSMAVVIFMVKITNNTGHIINLQGSDLGLMIAGKDWKKLALTGINNGWLNYFRVNYPYQQTVPQELTAAIQNVPLWNDAQKILPGKSVILYVPFDVAVGPGFKSATLSIYDLVTNTDQAGNPTERTSFDFNFKEGSLTIR